MIVMVFMHDYRPSVVIMVVCMYECVHAKWRELLDDIDSYVCMYGDMKVMGMYVWQELYVI
jgi:hypothetical protein